MCVAGGGSGGCGGSGDGLVVVVAILQSLLSPPQDRGRTPECGFVNWLKNCPGEIKLSNPPQVGLLGEKKNRTEFGTDYTNILFIVYLRFALPVSRAFICRFWRPQSGAKEKSHSGLQDLLLCPPGSPAGPPFVMQKSSCLPHHS